MKTAMIFANGMKQVMLTPETDDERAALKLLTPNDEITVETKWGSMFDTYPPSAAGYVVQESRGGYLRAYECAESLMLVIRPRAAPAPAGSSSAHTKPRLSTRPTHEDVKSKERE